METEQRRRPRWPAVAAALVAVSGAIGLGSESLGKNAPRQSRERIVASAREYLTRMKAFEGPLNVTVEWMEIAGGPGKKRPVWTVECNQEGAGYTGILVFDDRSGRIVGATVRREVAGHRRAFSNRAEAVDAAVAAARGIVPELARGPVRVGRPPEWNGTEWFVGVRSGRADAVISLDGATGQVCSLSVKYPNGVDYEEIARL